MTDARALHDKALQCYYPNRRLRVLQRALLRHVGPGAASARVLDVGCGPGVLGEWLHDRGVPYVGVDVDSDLGEFDVIVASEVLEHIEERRELLAALRSYLKPGGELLLSVPSISAFRWLKHMLGRPGAKISAREHRVEFAPRLLMPRDPFWMGYDELGAMIREAGYSVLWRKGVGAFDVPAGLTLADRMFRAIGSHPLDAVDWLCDLARGLIGCRYLCLGLTASDTR